MQVDEIKHYMHGLTQIHLQTKGVVYKVKFAEDVLFNEVNIIIIAWQYQYINL